MNIANYYPSPILIKMLKEEEMFVSWPYDDKGPWRNGRPIEYTGGKLKGTLTQGYGHTNAAGGKKIVLGERWTEAEATAVMQADISRFLPQFKKIASGLVGTQGQFDAIFSAYYNLTTASFKKLIAPWKAGNPQGTYDKFPLYVMSGGERMRGLVRRREKEMSLWRSGAAIAVSVDAGRAGDSTAPEKVDNPDAMTTKQKIGVGAAIAGAAGSGAGAVDPSGVGDTISSIQSTIDTVVPSVIGVQSLFEYVDIKVLVGIAVAGIIGYVGYRIYKKWKS